MKTFNDPVNEKINRLSDPKQPEINNLQLAISRPPPRVVANSAPLHSPNTASLDDDELLTLRELSNRSGLSVKTLRRYVDKGLIPFQQLARGKAIRVSWKEFLSLIAKSGGHLI